MIFYPYATIYEEGDEVPPLKMSTHHGHQLVVVSGLGWSYHWKGEPLEVGDLVELPIPKDQERSWEGPPPVAQVLQLGSEYKGQTRPITKVVTPEANGSRIRRCSLNPQ